MDAPPVLLSEEDISARIDELAAEIDRAYAGVGTLVLIGVLKGSFIFLSDLARRLTIPHRIEFIAVESYGAKEGEVADPVRLIMDVRHAIDDEHVLLVEDIVDLAIADLDGDGDLDAFAIVLFFNRLEVRPYLNDGNASFAINASNCPVNSFGWLMFGTAIPPTPVVNMTLLVNPVVTVAGVPTDALGHLQMPLPLPANLLPGWSLLVQTVFFNNVRCTATGPLSASHWMLIR